MSESPTPRPDRETRRAQLLGALVDAFREHGVAATSVDEVVRRAGVAKGTFYLYFDSKDDAVQAVVERMVDRVVDSVERAVDTPDLSPVERLQTFGRSLLTIGGEPYELELVELFHRPENRAVHERMAERVAARLAPLIERIVARGVAQGNFVAQDTNLAAWCVLGAFQAVERGGGDTEPATAPAPAPMTAPSPELIAARIGEVEAFVLRGLGYRPATDPEAGA